jgi:hypothetical protein
VVAPEFHEFLNEAAREAADFDGDEIELAVRARHGDRAAVSELITVYLALAVLTGLRLRPSWLAAPDAGQEAIIVFQRLVESGTRRIAVELPSAIQARFARMKQPPEAD